MATTDLLRSGDRRQQRAWYVYDWANSAFQTTVLTVFLGPYLTALAEAAAVDGFVRPLGIPVRAAAYYPYLVSFSALLQVVSMPRWSARWSTGPAVAGCCWACWPTPAPSGRRCCTSSATTSTCSAGCCSS